jgi:hypothetical protein
MRLKGYDDLKEFLMENSGFEVNEMEKILYFVKTNLKVAKGRKKRFLLGERNE